MFPCWSSALLASLALSSGVHASTSVYQSNAEDALRGLQTFYNESTGLWHSYGVSWWQSANALTTLANMVSLNDSSYVLSVADSVIPTTFLKAQTFNIAHNHHTKRQQPNQTQSQSPSQSQTQTPWTNGFYDDEGWWAMAWIRVYDVTGNHTYLDAAKGLFEDMTTGWGTNCSSQGLYWDKAHSAIAPISNVLFMEVAAYLANRVEDQKSHYVNWALKEWNWLLSTGIYQADQHLVTGSVNITSCAIKTDGLGFTYVQGSLMEALVSLSDATGNQTYLEEANGMASAVISNMSVNGVLQEPHIDQAHPGQSAPQFKGVFMRGLMRLMESSPNSKYTDFAEGSAKSIWSNDRSGANMLGPEWLGPFYGPADASPQSSAMDALVAAWSVASS